MAASTWGRARSSTSVAGSADSAAWISSERQKTRSAASTSNTVCYFGRMDRFLVPAAASIVVGLLLGAAAVFGVTLMVQQDSKPPLQAGDPASSVLNRVEYGDRS